MKSPGGAANSSGVGVAPYTFAYMNEEDVVRDERLLESCHHVHVKNLPAGWWVFGIAHLGVTVANLVLLIILITR